MEMQLDYYDAWTEAQKTFSKNIVTAQNEMRAQWLDSVQKVQDSINNLPGVQDNPQAKEVLKLYNAWFDNMLETSKTMSEEAFKVQSALQGAIEKQFELGRQVASNLVELSKPAKKK